MPTLRQSFIASVIRRYPLYSGCGSLANHRVVQRLAGASSETVWARVHGGSWVLAPLADYVGRAAFYAGELDRKVTWICRRLVRPGDTVLDIGANLGMVSVALSALVGSAGHVHAFEPNPEMQKLIKQAIARNGTANIHLHGAALGAQEGELVLSVPPGNAGGASLVSARRRAGGFDVKVPVLTLSSFLAEHQIGDVRLVKVDVEGFEPEVFAGGRDFFSSHPPDVILFELNDGHADVRSHATIEILAGFGYRFLSVPRNLVRMRTYPFDPDRVDETPIGNDFVAVRPGSTYDEVAGLLRAA